MRLGAAFPTLEIGGDPVAVRDWAQAAEDLGYDHILAFDHILGFRDGRDVSYFGPLTASVLIDEPLVLLAFLAAATSRIGLATGILVSPVRQTALLAKQAAEIDVLSGGRLRLGIGVGWVPRESAALNEDYTTRGRRIEEQLAVLRALWTEEDVTFDGQWHHLDQAGLAPRPVQRPVPVWMGGNAGPAVERAARLADGWMTGPIALDDDTRAMVEQFHRDTERFGRAVGSVGLEAFLSLPDVPPERWADHAAAWLAMGATHLTVSTMGTGLTSVTQHVDALAKVRAALTS